MSRKNTIALLPAPAKTFLAWLEFQKGMSEAKIGQKLTCPKQPNYE